MRLSVQEAARMLNVSTKTIYRWVTNGQIPAYRVNKQHRFDRSELVEWARAQRMTVATNVQLDPDHEEDPTPTLVSALEAGGIHYRIVGVDAPSVLRAAVDALRMSTDPARLFDALCAREELASTAIGGGFALPHVRNPLRFEVRSPAVGLCLLDHPVDWGAPDGAPITAVLVVLGATLRQVTRLHTHALFALRDPALSAAVTAQGPRDQILAEFRRVSATLRPWPSP